MENKKLNADETLALIGRMIDNTRNRMVRNSGKPFLIWGYTTIFVTAAVTFGVWHTQDYRINCLWLALPVIGWLLMWLLRDKNRAEGRVYTFVDRVIAITWAVIGFSALFISLLTIFNLFRMPILFIILLMISMQAVITCLILRFTPGAVCGIIGILLSPLLLVVSTDYFWSGIIFSAGFALMMVIPGHILNYKSAQIGKSCSKS